GRPGPRPCARCWRSTRESRAASAGRAGRGRRGWSRCSTGPRSTWRGCRRWRRRSSSRRSAASASRRPSPCSRRSRSSPGSSAYHEARMIVTVDGRRVELAAGATVLDAVNRLGLALPQLCKDPDRAPLGACRTCLVHVEGQRGTPAACHLPARDGMVVDTQHPEVLRRSHATKVGVFGDGPMSSSVCTSCGQCVATCPTGALRPKEAPGKIARTVETTCPYCGVGCGIELKVCDDGRLALMADDAPRNASSLGMLCVTGRFATGFVHARDRITRPMIKRDGRWHEASWDEALDAAADGLAK